MKTKIIKALILTILSSMFISVCGCKSISTTNTTNDNIMDGNVYNDGHQVIIFPEPPDF
jgi:hypothetical protein